MELHERPPLETTELDTNNVNRLGDGQGSPSRDGLPPHSTLVNVAIDRKSSYARQLEHWWLQNINLVVIHTSHAPTGGDPRDYLALERSYLGWLRTSTSIVSFGIIIAQLFILKHVDPTKGSALGALFSILGIVTCLLGCIRYFRLQKKLTFGRIETGGWFVVLYWLSLIILVVALLVIVLIDT